MDAADQRGHARANATSVMAKYANDHNEVSDCKENKRGACEDEDGRPAASFIVTVLIAVFVDKII